MNPRNHSLLILLLAGVISLLVPATPSEAQTNWERPWHFSVFGGGGFPEDDTLDDGPFAGVRLTRDLTEIIEMGFDISWQRYDDDFNSTKIGEADHVPFFVILKLNAPVGPDTGIRPYILGGAGVSYWNYDSNFSNVTADDDVSFTAKAGGGLEFAAGEAVDFFLEGGYMWAEYDVDGTFTESSSTINVSESVNTDQAFALFGIRLNF